MPRRGVAARGRFFQDSFGDRTASEEVVHHIRRRSGMVLQLSCVEPLAPLAPLPVVAHQSEARVFPGSSIAALIGSKLPWSLARTGACVEQFFWPKRPVASPL